MDCRAPLPDALENLTAMLLAADPADPRALCALKERLAEILRTTPQPSAAADALALAISGLDSSSGVEVGSLLEAAARATAASSQCPLDDAQAMAALETASAGLRAMLDDVSVSPPAEPAAEPVTVESGTAAASVPAEPLIDDDLLREFCAESRDRLATAEAAILQLEADAENIEAIHSTLRAFHTIKGAAGLLGLNQIQSLAHQAESLLIRGRDGAIRMAGRPIDLSLQGCDALRAMIDAVEAAGGHEGPLDESHHRLLTALAEAVDATPPTVAGACPVPAAPAEMESDAVAPSARTSATTAESGVRVNTERLDDLVNLVGELVIAQSILVQDLRSDGDASRLAQNAGHLGKIVRQLQDLAMGLRMVPLRATFQKMSRLVRDLAHRSGKSIQLRVSGEETEIDRNMVEALADPLLHMIRNAVAHGIELEPDRLAAGKAPAGTLSLRAYHAAGNVVLEVEDDGRGLDRDKIVAKAVARGLIARDHALAPGEIDRLIFHPGLSTAAEVTDVSGRGVGLDVVRRNVEALRGHVEVGPGTSGGTRFTLRLPLTMAIVDTMSVRVGSQQYLLPTAAIRRSFRPEPRSVVGLAGRATVVAHRGETYPLCRLHELFAVGGAIADPQAAMVVVIEGGGRCCGLLVDELLGQQQVVVKSLGKMLANLAGVSGGAILGNGRVGIILDAVELVQIAHR